MTVESYKILVSQWSPHDLFVEVEKQSSEPLARAVADHCLDNPTLQLFAKGGLKGENEDVTVLVHNAHLILYYTIGGKSPSGSFDIPLASIGKKEITSYHGSKGHTTVEKEYSIQGNVATQVITSYGRNWKCIERETLTAEGPHLINERTRNYFRKKYFITGEWVPDTRHENTRRNTLNIKMTFLKLSSTPISLDRFFEMIDKRPYQYVTISGEVSADNLRDKIEKGEYEIITDDEVQPQVSIQSETKGEIVDFASYRKYQKSCDDSLNTGNNILEFKPKGK